MCWQMTVRLSLLMMSSMLKVAAMECAINTNVRGMANVRGTMPVVVARAAMMVDSNVRDIIVHADACRAGVVSGTTTTNTAQSEVDGIATDARVFSILGIVWIWETAIGIGTISAVKNAKSRSV